MDITRLDTHGEETLGQKFTKPLRGVLGGRNIVGRADGCGVQGVKIYNVAKRILAAFVLIIGFVYTIPAVVVLLASPKPRKISGFEGWSEEKQKESVGLLSLFISKNAPITDGKVTINVNQTPELRLKINKALEVIKTSVKNSDDLNKLGLDVQVVAGAMAILSVNIKKEEDKRSLFGPLSVIDNDFDMAAVDF